MNTWLDFNDADDQRTEYTSEPVDTQALKHQLLRRLPQVLAYLYPKGVIRGGHFKIANLAGDKGESLVVQLQGVKAGLWSDFATGEGGDILNLWAARFGLDARRDFPRLVKDIREWLGMPVENHPTPAKGKASNDLGASTARWDYLDANGDMIACVYRYDPPGQRKQFLPWDVKRRKNTPPEPRPLYNQPGMLLSRHVVLVEGEKAAQALIDRQICATTAMNGAKAPVDKTDWSPLKGRDVLIWPDNDTPGHEYAEAVAKILPAHGVANVSILEVPPGYADGWDAADAVQAGLDVEALLRQWGKRVVHQEPRLPAYPLADLLSDLSPMPEDLIAPRVLTPAGLLVFAGAPKVGKTDFLLAWLTHMAAGLSFLGMAPTRPMKVFFLQAEIQYHYLRERLQGLQLPRHARQLAARNLVITPQCRLTLNDEGLATVVKSVLDHFPLGGPDIIAVDPLRNVFDAGKEKADENDNNAMLFFLSRRIDDLRRLTNPNAGIILAHHTRKMLKRQLEEDPFQAMSGASSMRGYYTSGAVLYRPDETQSLRHLIFELRNGPSLPTKFVDKDNGQWRELDWAEQRLVRQNYGQKLDAERRRKRDTILQVLHSEAMQGRLYTGNQFAERFENKAGLGARATILERLSILATKGHIKYCRSGLPNKLPKVRYAKFGYLCVEGMELAFENEMIPVLPTHYKCPQTGALIEVENQRVWVYADSEEVSE